MKATRRAFLGTIAGAALAAAGHALADEALWARLREGGHVLLIRHASTEPGLGDPKGYRLDDCSTQRNLSPQGREESKRIGERFRRERVPVAKVLTSPWCRCRETARLAFGAAEDWEPLSSFFDFPDREPAYSERIRKRIGTYGWRPPKGNVVMVTHNVNIAALTGISAGTGEIVVVRPDGCCGLRVVGRLRAD